ncbi:MAG TPA: lactate racemase domain-containing protein, partial [Chloroflexota bacterium]|nr:lactate racemase domain-containing protein [Chloroflexota bacterium]
MRIEFDIPEPVLHHLLDPVPIPQMARVRYDIPTPAPLGDIRAAVREQMERAGARTMVRPGQRIAVGVGSRGIGRLPEIVAALVGELRALGAEPFIIPTMGSHGGATAEGQREVLRHLGVTPERVGAPIEAQMETVEVGRAADGTPVRLDRLALAADGIVFVARVKPHTAYRGPHESGLAKMIAIGLGKQAGAAVCHARGFGHMARMVPALAEVALARAPIRFGLAVLENAYDEPYKLVVVPAQRLLADEPALLDEARRAMPRIPFDSLDVLVIDEIGKNISGDGADPNITGRYATPDASGGPEVNKQVVLDIADASGGNANGIGLADFTTVRAARKMDFGRTYPNALTSTVARPVALPMVLPSDRLAFAAALLTCNAVGR